MKLNQSAKRVNIVSIKLLKEGSVGYKSTDRMTAIHSRKNFLDELDLEHFLVVSLDTKSQPVSVNVCPIGSLNASLVHPKKAKNRKSLDELKMYFEQPIRFKSQRII